MNLIFGMKVIYLMRLDSLVKIVAERCTRNTTKVPTVWNINYQIIKNNNTTTQKKGIGVFFPDAFLNAGCLMFVRELRSTVIFPVNGPNVLCQSGGIIGSSITDQRHSCQID